MQTNRKDLICKLLKGIETGDPESVTVVNEDKYIQHNPQTHEGSEGLANLFKKLFLQGTPEEVQAYATAYLRNNPYADFLVRGDRSAFYDDVLQAMVLLKNAGVETVSLITQPPAQPDSE